MQSSKDNGRNYKLTALLAAASLAGIVSGAVYAKDDSSKAGTDGQQAGESAPAKADSEKHSCKGKNSCKGKGNCKAGDNGCKGKNSCKGKGGCKTNKAHE